MEEAKDCVGYFCTTLQCFQPALYVGFISCFTYELSKIMKISVIVFY